MPSMIRLRVLLVLLVVASACQTRRRVPLAPEPFGELPRRSVLVQKGSERVPIEEGRVTPDSVMGLRRDGGRFALPRDSIDFVEVSGGNTLGGLALMALWLGGVFLVIVVRGYAQTA